MEIIPFADEVLPPASPSPRKKKGLGLSDAGRNTRTPGKPCTASKDKELAASAEAAADETSKALFADAAAPAKAPDASPVAPVPRSAEKRCAVLLPLQC